MAKFLLKRFYPTSLQIEATDKQILQMFPVEKQEHPFMGIISRVWLTDNREISVDNFPQDEILDLSKDGLHLQLKPEKLEEILSSIDKFKIVLYYEGKEDVYEVERID